MDSLYQLQSKANLLFNDIEEDFFVVDLMNALPCAVICSDYNNEIIACNNSTLLLFQYTEDEMLTKTWVDITYPEDREISLRLSEYHSTKAFNNIYHIPKRYVDSQGSIIYAITSISNVYLNTINKIATIIDFTKEQDTWHFFHGEFRKQII